MAKELVRYLSVKEAAEKTGLPRSLLTNLIGSGLVEDTLAIGVATWPVGARRRPVKLYVGERALSRALLMFEDALRDRPMASFRAKCARGLGINAPDEENNVLDLQEAINSAAKTEQRKKKARTA